MSDHRIVVARLPYHALSVVLPAIIDSYPMGGVLATWDTDGEWATVTIPGYGAVA